MKKKTRARVTTPVSRRIKKQYRRHRDLEKTARDPLIRTNWKNKNTLRQNIETLTLDKMAEKLPSDYMVTANRLSEQDTLIVKRLINEFGNNYEAMARDRKINYWQWPATRCQHQVEIYNSIQK